MAESCRIATIRRIEMAARRDPGGRGLAGCCADMHHLLPAAVDLLAGERVIIVTGFCARAAMAGETDGPSGTLALADALRRLGKDVVLVSDEHSAPLLAAGAALFGTPFATVSLSLRQDEADRQIDSLLRSFAPTQVVAIERPGSAADGHRYSMFGEMLDDLIPSADRLLAPPFVRTWTTIGIGDGGNELGMGSLRERFKSRIPHGEMIFAATAADYAIPAGVSNWGAFALVAALAILSGCELLRPPEHERAVLEAIIAAGAVDGCTKRGELSVDCLGWEDYAGPIAEIYRECRLALAEALS